MIDTFGDNLLEGFEYESPSHEGNQFKDFLCVLEGFKTKFKNLHLLFIHIDKTKVRK